MTFKQLQKDMHIDPKTKVMHVRSKEIALVYYRTGYQFEQYASTEDWEVREQIELSMAIKCPTIDLHLLTFKKFQQSFSD